MNWIEAKIRGFMSETDRLDFSQVARYFYTDDLSILNGKLWHEFYKVCKRILIEDSGKLRLRTANDLSCSVNISDEQR